jgi:hypothetical protein
MYRVLLLANTIFEGFIGVMMLFMPQIILRTNEEIATTIARMFGVAVISNASLSAMLFIFVRSKTALLSGFVALSIFHIGMAMVQTINFTKGYAQFTDPIVHAIFGFMFLGSLIKEVRQY